MGEMVLSARTVGRRRGTDTPKSSGSSRARMQFRTFDELTPSMDAGRLLVHLSSLGGATDRRAVDVWRRRSDLFAEYVGIFAVERGQVLGQTLVKRLAYRFPDGEERIGAIASVGTRPDRARRGIARRILEEVHRREREAGIRYTALWTNPSWGAHRLYERLGYADTYAFPWAVLPPSHRPAASRIAGVTPARSRDLAPLDRLHDRLAEDRLGFCRHPRGFLPIAAATREVDPKSELLVLRRNGRIAGYAHLVPTRVRTLCGEIVAAYRRDRARLVRAIEARAAGTTVAFQHTPVSDDPALFRARGYAVLDAGWYTLMTAALRGPWDARTARATFRPDDPRFLCCAGDRF